jgi:hypothetical protein
VYKRAKYTGFEDINYLSLEAEHLVKLFEERGRILSLLELTSYGTLSYELKSIIK